MVLLVNDNAAKMIQSFKKDEGKEILSSLAACWNEIYWSSLDDKSDNRPYKDAKELKFAGVALLTEFILRLNHDE